MRVLMPTSCAASSGFCPLAISASSSSRTVGSFGGCPAGRVIPALTRSLASLFRFGLFCGFMVFVL